MKRIHIISVGDPRLSELAITLKTKGNEVTCSGVDIMESVKAKLKKFDILPLEEGWFPEKLNKEYDFVIPAGNIAADNPELAKARELNLLVLSYPEYIFTRIKNKTRVMVSGGKNMNDVIRMMFFAMQKNNLLFDHVISVDNQDIPSMSWGYDARMAILEDDDSSVSPFIKKQINEYYHPHILVLPDLHWEPSDIFPEYEDYLQSMKRLIASIERDGKLIYNERISDLGMLAGLIREDVTAMPYKIHPVKEEDGHTLLTSRFGEFKVNKADDAFLENINAARIACRQMGLQDKDFYEAISEYSFK